MSTATTLAPHRGGDHDGGQADAAAAVHRDPLARPHLGDLVDRAEGGGEPAAERGRGRVRHLFRQRDQVDVGVVDRHQLGEGAPVGEPRLRLPLAHLLLA
ncbi:hypothetical protein ACFSTC_17715 [Nonomuraea ferruginea]